MPALENDKHERFCQEYLIDLCQVRAYMAVYPKSSYDSARASSSDLLANPNVLARVNELKETRAAKFNLTSEWVLERLQLVYERCMQATPVEKWDYEEKKMVQTGEFIFDSKGANTSLQLLGRHIAMFTDKVITIDEEGLAESIRKARERGANGEEKPSRTEPN